MQESLNPDKLEAKREAYLMELFQEALSGNLDAGDTLSRIALGGASERARELVRIMDAGGKEDLPPPFTPIADQSSQPE